MARWKPDAEGRLIKRRRSTLFDEQGYEATTVAEIAERAGLTKRTFFRHFADKREVLFSGSQELQRLWLEGHGRAAPAEGRPALAAVVAGLDPVAASCSPSAMASPGMRSPRSSPPTRSCRSAS